jgi:hypothetical protein
MIEYAYYERDKCKRRAHRTGLFINVAIGLQVFFGALTTGLAAVVSGKNVRYFCLGFLKYSATWANCCLLSIGGSCDIHLWWYHDNAGIIPRAHAWLGRPGTLTLTSKRAGELPSGRGCGHRRSRKSTLCASVHEMSVSTIPHKYSSCHLQKPMLDSEGHSDWSLDENNRIIEELRKRLEAVMGDQYSPPYLSDALNKHQNRQSYRRNQAGGDM